MDQLQDFLTYKHFFELKNITTGSGHHMNLTLAEQIVADFENNLITVHHFTTVILLTLYIPIFLVGLFGNLLIIVSVSADKVKKAKLYFLVNLALADLAVTVFCMPTSIGTNVYRLWVYGQFLCKFSAFIQGEYTRTLINPIIPNEIFLFLLIGPVQAQKSNPNHAFA